jgi:hypothetical protein
VAWEAFRVRGNIPDSEVTDYEYRQRVRRYKPSSLVPLIASAAARYRDQQEWLRNPYRKYTPWALADAARVSLAYGNEYRADATEQDLLQVLNAYSRFDPLWDQDAAAFMLRMSGEQLPWQSSDYEALARTAGVFAQTKRLMPAECLVPGWDTDLLGCTLAEYVGIAQLIYFSAVSCEGRFDLALFDTPDGEIIARHVSRDTVVQVLGAHFAISQERFRAADQEAAGRAGTDDRLRRFTYNPLRGTPLVTGFDSDYLCPIPQLAWDKATPWGVYFTGISHYKEKFARDLGHLFEQYVGRQLRLLSGARILPEITFGQDGSRKTIDWIVILPELVLLVEVKSAIPTEPVRLGTPDAAGAMVKKLGKAFTQIDRTARLIADRDPALAAVPADRPVLGMAVTLEPFHMANAPFDLLPPATTPTTVTSAAELEVLVTITDTPPGRLLLDRAADPVRSTWSLDTALDGHERSRNPILDEAWNLYPWASANRANR